MQIKFPWIPIVLMLGHATSQYNLSSCIAPAAPEERAMLETHAWGNLFFFQTCKVKDYKSLLYRSCAYLVLLNQGNEAAKTRVKESGPGLLRLVCMYIILVKLKERKARRKMKKASIFSTTRKKEEAELTFHKNFRPQFTNCLERKQDWTRLTGLQCVWRHVRFMHYKAQISHLVYMRSFFPVNRGSLISLVQCTIHFLLFTFVIRESETNLVLMRWSDAGRLPLSL